MGCRCAERRAAVTAAAHAVLQGDMQAARREAGVITRTAVEDMARVIRLARAGRKTIEDKTMMVSVNRSQAS
ncbi:hypothetical protein Mnod_2465 [Methylobacterium nodulans ORS 2060]|uniref:Uncharacterized protein n=1 Tax=Methylobacterium nodulans (strain LMG 21967 / CNCM I-2342 / ORS 2060) TaxID=460265 RepID=B8ICM4_METNO|nr:hypothetical protein Mnod_2465 [Methylobacterium nodulans ORS 2060]